MKLVTQKAHYELEVINGEAVVSICQISSCEQYTIYLYAYDLLNLLNTGGEAYVKMVDGNYTSIFFNLKNGHLRTPNNRINTYLPNFQILSALKKELSDLVDATYAEDRRLA